MRSRSHVMSDAQMHRMVLAQEQWDQGGSAFRDDEGWYAGLDI